MSTRVFIDHAGLAAGFAARLNALTEDSPSDAYLIPGRIEIRHGDDWHIAVAYFQDDAWLLDFTHYGTDGDLSSDGVLLAAALEDVYGGDQSLEAKALTDKLADRGLKVVPA
jgi:hypothetical protein